MVNVLLYRYAFPSLNTIKGRLFSLSPVLICINVIIGTAIVATRDRMSIIL